MGCRMLIPYVIGLCVLTFKQTNGKVESLTPERIVPDPCVTHKIWELFILKGKLQSKLMESVVKISSDNSLSKKTKIHQTRVIQIFQKEINDTTILFYDSLATLRRLLKGDYRSLRELKETSRKRLEELKRATVEEEEEYKKILGEERVEKDDKLQGIRSADTPVRAFLGSILNDISLAADKLELSLQDGFFQEKVHSKSRNYHIETVLKVDGKSKDDFLSDGDDSGVVTLIDSSNNKFVLSKPKDSTVTHVDHALITDIICIFISALTLSGLCSWFNFPNMFAMIATGILLGPAGLNVLKCIVQIETLGEFGVFFILFAIGVDFSPEQLQLVLRPSIYGTIGITVILNVLGILGGAVFGIKPQQSIFLACCMAFSSTSVMTKLINLYDHTPSRENQAGSVAGKDYKAHLVGMLVSQDILLSIFIALLPILAGHFDVFTDGIFKVPNVGVMHHFMHRDEKEVSGSVIVALWMVLELLFAIAGLIFLCFFVSKHVIGRFFRLLNYVDCGEMVTLGIFGLLFIMLNVTDHLGISMELGCFTCGVIVGSQGEQLVKQVTNLTEPVKIFFSCLFFVSIGLHVFPAFVLSEIAIMVPLTCLIVGTKFFVSVGVLHYIDPGNSTTNWIVSAGLAELSEFSFVLGSRGRRFGLISREVFLTILAVTTLSLLLTPLSWKAALRFANGQGIRPELRKLLNFFKRSTTTALA